MSKKLTNEEFIAKCKLVHQINYDYSLVNYKNARTKVIIICPYHGAFLVRPDKFLSNKVGCYKCSIDKKRLTTNEFITKSNIIHDNKYDYSLVDYKNYKVPVIISCPIHGEFTQSPKSHLAGHGCQKCSHNKLTSKGEKEVLSYLKTIYIGEIIENDREQIKPKELDIYLPAIKLAIEYNGEYWHKKRELETPGYHELKEKLCNEHKISLLTIWEND